MDYAEYVGEDPAMLLLIDGIGVEDRQCSMGEREESQ
jgi:hypothetical protein